MLQWLAFLQICCPKGLIFILSICATYFAHLIHLGLVITTILGAALRRADHSFRGDLPGVCIVRVCVCVCVCLIVCDLETSTMRWTMPEVGCSAMGGGGVKIVDEEYTL